MVQFIYLVVTRWYKAPELLMGLADYDYGVDVFGVGIICGELYKRKPLLPGMNDQDQLQKIFDFIGDPTSINWSPRTMFTFIPGKKPILLDKFAVEYKVSVGAVTMIKKLLYINPQHRITAEEATRFTWFKCSPFGTEPGKIDIKGEHHEISQNSTQTHYGPPRNHRIAQPTSIQNRNRNAPNLRTRGSITRPHRGGRPY
eukprot:NODE_302_length_10333_cov_0.506840.p6 type:complete len:200 gc:universal NODE_302_length_10333_cov_0.506840:7727-7128(-)